MQTQSTRPCRAVPEQTAATGCSEAERQLQLCSSGAVLGTSARGCAVTSGQEQNPEDKGKEGHDSREIKAECLVHRPLLHILSFTKQ